MTKFKIQNKFSRHDHFNTCGGIPPQVRQLAGKFQNPNIKTKVLLFVICALTLFCALCFGICHLYAQDNQKLVTLSKQIIEAKTNQELYTPFAELKDFYLKDNKYSEFVEFLKSLGQKKEALAPFVDYYVALGRFQQLKYLEETQSWDEYFSQGNAYREQITEAAQKVILATTNKDTLNIYARLLLWQFHKGQEDALQEAALSDLMSVIPEYAKETTNPAAIKEIADKLFSYGEKGKSKELYKIYVDKLVTADIKDAELELAASGFYKEGNLDLAEALYDVYIARITKAEKTKKESLPALVGIAKKFSYKDEGLADAAYAEKIFKKIEEIGAKDAFNEELLYLRAFNLEKAKEYSLAKDIYLDLVKRYPATVHADEADFKTGIIYTYVLRDIKTGRAYFEKLAEKQALSPQAISGLYELGLLSQWAEDLVKAKEYYNKLIEKAKGGFIEIAGVAKERLKEIEEAKSLEYNLRTFLDVTFKDDEYGIMDMSKLDLRARPYKARINEGIEFNAYPYLAQTGCLQVQLQYLWSGDLGSGEPSLDEPALKTTYASSGTKVINLVVFSSTGIVDRSIDFVDID